MKKLSYIFISICAFYLITTSCENKWPKNGYLDGMWQVMNINHNSEQIYTYDEKTPPTDEEIHYISFQLSVFQLSNRNDPNKYYGYFSREGNYIRLYQVSYGSKNETLEDDNIVIPDSLVNNTIKPWGLYSNNNTFNVQKLTENEMVLHNDSVTIELRKF